MKKFSARIAVLEEAIDWLEEDRLRGNEGEGSQYADALRWLIGLLEDMKAHQIILRNYGPPEP